MTQVDPQAAQMVAAQRLTTVARGIQAQVDRRVERVERSSSGLRRVTVASRDPANLTCQVYLDGDTSSPVPCGLLSPAVVPVVGAMGWAHQNGTDLLLAGTDAGLPKAKLRGSNTRVTDTSEVAFDFRNSGIGPVMYDTDYDGSNHMADVPNDRLMVRWPGYYDVGAHVFASGVSGAAHAARIQEVNSLIYIGVGQEMFPGTTGEHGDVMVQRFFNAGDGVRLMISSSSSNITWGTSSNEIGMALWLAYRA